jgi:CRISPR-associated protein Cas1
MFSTKELSYKQIVWICIEPTEKAKLKLKIGNLVLEKDGKIANQMSLHKVLSIYIVGRVNITSQILEALHKQAISVFFLKNNCRLYAQFTPKTSGNYLLRHKQYNTSLVKELEFGKKLVQNKIKNHIKLLYRKDQGVVIEELKDIVSKVKTCTSEKQLLNLEGRAAKTFFQNYFAEIGWLRRSPRTKADIPNLLLDIGYSYAFNMVDALLNLYGFDTFKGVYHKLFFQRKSLSCDLVEPLRPLIDRAVLKMYNLGQINQKDFKIYNHRYVLGYKEASKYSKIFLTALLDYKEEIAKYIQGYYRHFMDPDKNQFQSFEIKI